MSSKKTPTGTTPIRPVPFLIPKIEPIPRKRTNTGQILTPTTNTTANPTPRTTKAKPTATITSYQSTLTSTSTTNNPAPSTVTTNNNNSVSIASTANTFQPNNPITLSPNSYAAMTSPASTAKDLLPRVDIAENPNSVSGTTKQEPSTSNNQQQSGIKERNKQLKLQGRIRITLHGTEVYSEPEIICILHTLRARKAIRAGPNLYSAEVLTGTYTHASQIDNQINLNVDQIQEEMGPQIDQSTQVSGNDIDLESRAIATNSWQPLKPIPELIETHNIIPSSNKPNNVKFNQRAFINYSKYAIPEEVAIILSMGPKFAVPVYHSVDDFECLRDAAIAINEIFGHPEEKGAIRCNIEEYIEEYQHTERTKHATENKDYFQHAIHMTKQFMKEHPDLIASQSDKARASILMEKETYINKVENLLKDQTTYQPIQTSSTRSYMKMNEKLLERMVKLKLVSEKEAKSATNSEEKPANLYGLLKTHKKDKPMRPIVNTRNTMGFLAAEKVTAILTSTRDVGLKYNVLNSRQACELIRHTMILPDEKLYSLDIVSMFTNITTERAIAAVRRRQKQLHITNEHMQLIVEVIQFVCVKSTEIRFNNRIYKQIKGLRMGSSLSPILADFVVEDMLDAAFTTIERPKLIMKYVDDILCIMEEKIAPSVLTALNECDPHIKFEMETEQNGRINYLDVTIQRDGYSLITIWFQKHISSGQFLNHNSNHSKANIWNTAVQYVVTMFMNTHPVHHEEMTTIAMDRLTRNSYPPIYAQRVIDEAKEKIAQNQRSMQVSASQSSVTNIRYTPSIDYIPKLSEKIQKVIQDSANRVGEEDGTTFQIPAKPMYTANKLIYNRYKDSNQTFNIEDHDQPNNSTSHSQP